MTPIHLDPIALTILTFVIDVALRSLVVALVIGAVMALMPRGSGTLRLRVWTLVLCALLALPVLGLVTPAWRWPVPSVSVLTTWAPALHVTESPVASVIEPAKSDVPARASLSGPVIAAAIYLAGVFWLMVQASLAWLFIQRLRRRTRAVDDVGVLARLARHSRSAGLAEAPHLADSPELFAPVTMFVRRPMVVLPDDWRGWPAEHMDAVLAHEVSHVARHDALTQRLALLYRGVFWFSPLSWWLKRHLDRLAELASDESALTAGIEPVTYAGVLLACFVRAHEHPRRASWYLAMARRDDADAARRVERILSWKGGPSMT